MTDEEIPPPEPAAELRATAAVAAIVAAAGFMAAEVLGGELLTVTRTPNAGEASIDRVLVGGLTGFPYPYPF